MKKIIHEITKNLPHYFSLGGLLAVALFGLINFQYDKPFQSVIVISVCVSFVVWGAVHHYLMEDHHYRILLEYFAIAFFGATILISVIWQI